MYNIVFIFPHSENSRTLKEAQPVNAFMNVMQQMGINFGSGDGTNAAGQAAPPSISVADVGMVIQDEFRPKSKNVVKLRRILGEGPGVIDNPVVICFKIGNEDVIYADFTQGKGKRDYFSTSVSVYFNVNHIYIEFRPSI